MAMDFSRMYSFKAELKTLSDAAAMSAALDLVNGVTESQAESHVTSLLSLNRVEGSQLASITSSDVTPVTWNFATKVASSTTWANANAVQVVAHYTASWSLARMFNVTTRVLSETSIAALGSRKTHSCIKPFVFPYGAVLSQLGKSPTNVAYNLTAVDINALSSYGTAKAFAENDSINATATAEYEWGNTYQGGTTQANFASALTGCASGTLGVDSILRARPNIGDTTSILNAEDALCGSATVCATPTIMVPIYDSGVDTTVTIAAGQTVCTGKKKKQHCTTTTTTTYQSYALTYHIKYVGAFQLTKQDTSGIWGYFTTINSPHQGASTFTTAPGPVTSAVIVK